MTRISLDQLTQLLLLFDDFKEIVGLGQGCRYLGHWAAKWAARQISIRSQTPARASNRLI